MCTGLYQYCYSILVITGKVVWRKESTPCEDMRLKLTFFLLMT